MNHRYDFRVAPAVQKHGFGVVRVEAACEGRNVARMEVGFPQFPHKWAYLLDLHVLEHARHLGLGTSLINRAIDLARDEQCRVIQCIPCAYVETPTERLDASKTEQALLERFYHARGFTPVPRSPQGYWSRTI
jgi:GNAT superfamily N-acetyltransferase